MAPVRVPQADAPGVGGGAAAAETAGVDALVELVGHDAEVATFQRDVSRDGRRDALAVFVPAEDTSATGPVGVVARLLYGAAGRERGCATAVLRGPPHAVPTV